MNRYKEDILQTKIEFVKKTLLDALQNKNNNDRQTIEFLFWYLKHF